jgi:hypothetical protein
MQTERGCIISTHNLEAFTYPVGTTAAWAWGCAQSGSQGHHATLGTHAHTPAPCGHWELHH